MSETLPTTPPTTPPAMTVLSMDEARAHPLVAAGRRAGADSGDPQVSNAAIAERAGGSLGIWECAPGGWPVVDRPDTEVAVILGGRARLTDDVIGEVRVLGAGDVVILPAGWTGRWDVEETLRKVYAIY